MRDTNNPRQNKRLEQITKHAEAQDDAAFVVVMDSAEGRRVVCRLARDLGWMGEIWDASNARQTDFNAGKQSAARHVMGWAERVAPAQFLTAIGEATRRDVEHAEMAKAAIIPKPEEQTNG